MTRNSCARASTTTRTQLPRSQNGVARQPEPNNTTHTSPATRTRWCSSFDLWKQQSLRPIDIAGRGCLAIKHAGTQRQNSIDTFEHSNCSAWADSSEIFFGGFDKLDFLGDFFRISELFNYKLSEPPHTVAPVTPRASHSFFLQLTTPSQFSYV
jgi:hypothetical protein